MEVSKRKFKTIDEYLSVFPASTKVMLTQIRETIKKLAPEAEELISYNMPAFRLNGMLVWYAAYKEHIGFYPTPSGIKAFQPELSRYTTSKGGIQFPIDQPIPISLVKKIVRFRMNENLERKKTKTGRSSKTKRQR